jgi:hypothetical protein
VAKVVAFVPKEPIVGTKVVLHIDYNQSGMGWIDFLLQRRHNLITLLSNISCFRFLGIAIELLHAQHIHSFQLGLVEDVTPITSVLAGAV